MQKTCANCSNPFEITENDLAFYDRISPTFKEKKYSIPPPTLCPDCRFQRRLAHHNERHLYERTCAKTKEDIISIYSPDKDLTIYDVKEWWTDSWDPMDYGRDIDFSRSFFEQFADLRKQVPRMSLTQENTENSMYTSCVSNLKNCYLLFTSDFSKDCAYGIWTQNSKDCYDNIIIDNCELAYECVFCNNIYHSSFVLLSSQCHHSAFLFDCSNCSNCFMCHGLRNKEYHINNVEYTKEKYLQKIKEFPISSQKNLEVCKKRFKEIVKSAAHLYMWRGGRIINSTGDLLVDTENCIECYELVRSKDCKYCLGYEMKDAMDCTYGNAEFGYENCECFPMAFQSAFNVNSYTGSNLYYCDMCMNNCFHCFGCIGLKHKEYCIFNKQYTKEEYNDLVPRLIEHMRSHSEWGEFFPIAHSNFAYNESLGQDYFPLAKEEAVKKGYNWLEQENKEYVVATCDVPDDINDVPDSLVDEILACSSCKKNYRIIKQELKFYKKRGLPIPLECFECRYQERKQWKNPRKLWKRKCMKCEKDIQTSYSPERPESVYCEKCYLKEVY